ncbi:MAG: metallophosphoesterase family protein [Halioglobus sp.]
MNKLTSSLLVSTLAIGLAACHDDSDNNRPTPPPVIPEPEPVSCSGTQINPERLYLQQLGTDSVIIKWRGNLAEDDEEAGSLCFGTDMNALLEDSESGATVTATDHSEVLLTDLEPATTYYYSVGGAGTADAEHHFTTAPEVGTLPADGNTRIWLLGDSGTGGQDKLGSAQVRDGYLSYVEASGGETADLALMLGDNAYNQGTDFEHQKAIFDIYNGILSSTPLWPVIGNHDMGFVGAGQQTDTDDYIILGSDENGGEDPEPDSPMPYLNIFTLPTNGEVGGLASGTEQYYSFDYANIHIVALDSQVAARDESNRAAMQQWLEDDLMASSADWTIVIFHHPPYAQLDHDSDDDLSGIDQPMIDMREQFTPVFEAYNVDLVYNGHSHTYERTYYLNGHTGLSDTFDPDIHAELNDQGEPASGQGDEAYTQIARNGTDDKVVYTVAGSAGKAEARFPGAKPHPAVYFGQVILGSVVLDVGESSLEANFIDVEGNILESFTMTR